MDCHGRSQTESRTKSTGRAGATGSFDVDHGRSPDARSDSAQDPASQTNLPNASCFLPRLRNASIHRDRYSFLGDRRKWRASRAMLVVLARAEGFVRSASRLTRIFPIASSTPSVYRPSGSRHRVGLVFMFRLILETLMSIWIADHSDACETFWLAFRVCMGCTLMDELVSFVQKHYWRWS